jgi:hypothetical protein
MNCLILKESMCVQVMTDIDTARRIEGKKKEGCVELDMIMLYPSTDR